MCRQNQQQQHSKQRVHHVTEGQEEDSDDSVYHVEYVGALHHSEGKKLFLYTSLMNQEMQLFSARWTGATCNVMSFKDLCTIKQHGDPQLAPITAKLKLYDNSMLSVRGECDLLCELQGNRHQLNFKIISGS